MNQARPASRDNFEIAILCAIQPEVEAVRQLFDHDWEDDGQPYDKAPGDPNAYSTGLVGRHNVVLAHLPNIGKVAAAAVASNCRKSFPNVKLALIVGICGAVPSLPDGKTEIFLGDVVFSTGVIQYDLGRQFPTHFERKDTLEDSLGRPTTELRALLQKLRSLQDRKKLQSKLVGHLTELQKETEIQAEYPGCAKDRLFKPTYCHKIDWQTCEECKCDEDFILRCRIDQTVPQPAIHFGVIASGDKVMMSGKERDEHACRDTVVGFEMESAGVWDTFPCVVIKGASDYADSHKTKEWQRYASATAAACAKAFLEYWSPSASTGKSNFQPCYSMTGR